MAPPRENNSEQNNTHPETRLAILLNEGLKRKGLTIRKLSELSGIATKHLENMSGGNVESLPPAPYLRSYLLIIGRLLDFDGQAVWEHIRVDELAIRSGKDDKLSTRRQPLSSKTKLLWLGGIALLLGLYLLFRLPQIVGQPSLEIGFPTEDVSTVGISPVTVIGKVKNGDEFFVNGERLPLGPDGVWQKNIDLQEGMNTIELTAKKFLGQEIKVLKQVIYTPTTTSSSTTDTLNASSTENTSSSKKVTTSSRP